MINFPTTPEEFVNNKCYCNSWVATAVVGSAAIGGAVKAYAASEASSAQVAGANKASQIQIASALEGWKQIQHYYGLATDQLKPYQEFGKTGIEALTAKLPSLTSPLPVSQEQLDLQKPLNVSQEQLDLQKPIELTQEQLEKIPGYEFTRTQGLKAVQNSAAARGLGVSGAAQKGAATFATGLADSTWQNAFAAEMANRTAAFSRYSNTFAQTAAERNAAASRYQQVWQNQVTGQQTAFDRLMAVIGAGGSAATTGAAVSQKTGADINKTFSDVGKGVAGTTIGAANAEAAGINAIGGAVSDFAKDIGGYAAYKGLYGGGIGSTPNLEYVKGTAGDMYVPTFGGPTSVNMKPS